MGATISLLQRVDKISVDPLAPWSTLVLQAFVRTMIGFLFGALIPVISAADLALGFVKDQHLGLFVFSVVAGFNERFVPDILENLGKKGQAGADSPGSPGSGSDPT